MYTCTVCTAVQTYLCFCFAPLFICDTRYGQGRTRLPPPLLFISGKYTRAGAFAAPSAAECDKTHRHAPHSACKIVYVSETFSARMARRRRENSCWPPPGKNGRSGGCRASLPKTFRAFPKRGARALLVMTMRTHANCVTCTRRVYSMYNGSEEIRRMRRVARRCSIYESGSGDGGSTCVRLLRSR